MSIAIITAFINRIIALKKPIKESKKKLKYKNTLYALKLSKASIFEFRLRNINWEAILFIIIFSNIAVNTGTIFKNKSSHILGEKNKRIAKMTKPTTKNTM